MYLRFIIIILHIFDIINIFATNYRQYINYSNMNEAGEMTMYSGEGGAVSASPQGGFDILDVFDRYIKARDLRKGTKETYGYAFTNFMNWAAAAGKDTGRLYAMDIKEYKDYLLEKRHTSPYTVNLYMTVLSSFFAWTEHYGIHRNITVEIRQERTTRTHAKDPLTLDEANRLLDMLRAKDLRDYTMIRLMLLTGMRTVEVSRATIKDLTTEHGQPIIRIWGKGRSEADRKAPLVKEMWETLGEYLETCRPGALQGEPLFINHRKGYKEISALTPRRIQKIVKDALIESGLDAPHKITPHSLRHTFANLLMKNGGTPYDVKQCLGHESLDTSERYMADAAEEKYIMDPPQKHLEGLLR